MIGSKNTVEQLEQKNVLFTINGVGSDVAALRESTARNSVAADMRLIPMNTANVLGNEDLSRSLSSGQRQL